MAAIDQNIVVTFDEEQMKTLKHLHLRDTFATAALTGLLSTGVIFDVDAVEGARAAYIYADAMLKQREQ